MTGPSIGALFAGYGGLEMGVQAALGGDLAWYSEIDKGALKILTHRHPDVPNVGDVTTADWSQVEPVDILTGGSPCQDLSHAGKRAGMTDGTRSNLWVAMREAIAQLRPGLVVWENVRGAASAEADSDLEFCPGCMGEAWYRGPSLRALGRVVGDLADLGYVGGVHGLRAADIGAPHGRFRFILAAHPEGHPWRFGYGDGATAADTYDHGRQHARHGGDQGAAHSLLPSPSTSDTNGPGAHGDGGLDLRTAVALLPTPAVNDMGAAYTPDEWDAWTDRMKAEHGNGNGHGKSLSIEAARLLPTPTDMTKGGGKSRSGDRSGEALLAGIDRLLPTPTAADSAASGGSSPADVTLTDAVVRTDLGRKDNDRHASTTEARPGEVLRGLRDSDEPQEVQRETRGPNGLPAPADLLAELWQHEGVRREGHAALAGQEAQGPDLPGLRNGEAPSRSPRGPESSEQQPGQPDDALRELPSETPLAGGSGGVDWGAYTDAIHRWELILGRPAPLPTQLSAKGNPQLSAAFCEWMMGLPAGWVTDTPGITRNEALKALGNGVVPQQAEAALRFLLPALERSA